MNLKLYLKRSSPTILSILACVGVVGSSYLSAKASPKAIRLLKEVRELQDEDLSLTEKIKVAAPVFVPAAAVGLGTIGCILGANVLSRKNQAALTSAYALLERSYKEYKNKVSEILGEEKEREIVLQTMEAEWVPLDDPDPDGDGTLLFWEETGRRYFNRKMVDVLDAEYQLNRLFILRGYATLNDFYKLLDLEPTPSGAVLGWSMGAGFESYGYEWVDFEIFPVTLDDGLECYILRMPFEPTADYMDF